MLRLPLVAALVLTALLTAALISAVWQTSSAATSAEIGVAPTGQNSVEYVGIVDQNGANFTAYGYLTYIAGITDTLLFSDPLSRTESTARFTFYGTATMTARSVVNNAFNLNADGQLTFYYDEDQGADFGDPTSFMRGAAVADAAARFQNVLMVTAPNTGIANGVAELHQTAATSFVLAGQSYQLGRNSLDHRFEFDGFGTRLEPVAPRALIVIAGNGQVTGARTFLPQVQRNEP
jgi:hypothetical protein